MISTVILATVTLGVLSTLLSSRQMTDFTRKQLLVDTAMQGLLEQLKSKTPTDLLTTPTQTWFQHMSTLKTYLSGGGVVTDLKIDLDNNIATPLVRIVLSPYDLAVFNPATQILPGAIPSDVDGDGYGDLNGDGLDDVGVNLLTLDVRGTTGLDGSVSVAGDDLKIYVMAYINDRSQSTAAIPVPSAEIILYYTWIYKEAGITRKIVDSVRGFRTLL